MPGTPTTLDLPSLRSIRLTIPQQAALMAAMRSAITTDDGVGRHRASGQLTGLARRATIDRLVELGLVEESRFEHEEYVATARGVKYGRQNGMRVRLSIPMPKTERERAIILRELTMPDISACGEKDAHYPRFLSCFPGRGRRWIEQLGYGRFEQAQAKCGVLQLVLTEKGQKLVAATDMPLTVPLTPAMARNLKRGALCRVIVPHPGNRRPAEANFQILQTDHLRSATDTWARLYDPAAVYPGTLIRLVDGRSGRLVASARAGRWNRIWLRCNEAGGHPIFDVIYGYSDQSALDQHARRIWEAFPYDRGEYAPGQKARAFAASCGFDSINQMRGVWLRRSKVEEGNRKEDVHGLIIDLHEVDLGELHGRRKRAARKSLVVAQRGQKVGSSTGGVKLAA